MQRLIQLPHSARRRGTLLSLAAVLMVLLFGFAAFSVDVGYIRVVRSELQQASETAALAAVSSDSDSPEQLRAAAIGAAFSRPEECRHLVLSAADIETGLFDPSTRGFSPRSIHWNAVRVTARATNEPLFFSPLPGESTFNLSRTAVAAWNLREFAFVITLRQAAEQSDSGFAARQADVARQVVWSAVRALSDRNAWLPAGAADRACLVTLIDNDGPQGFLAAPLSSDLTLLDRAIQKISVAPASAPSGSDAALEKARKVLRTVAEGGQARDDAERVILHIDNEDESFHTKTPSETVVRFSFSRHSSASVDDDARRLQQLIERTIATPGAHLVR